MWQGGREPSRILGLGYLRRRCGDLVSSVVSSIFASKPAAVHTRERADHCLADPLSTSLPTRAVSRAFSPVLVSNYVDTMAPMGEISRGLLAVRLATVCDKRCAAIMQSGGGVNGAGDATAARGQRLRGEGGGAYGSNYVSSRKPHLTLQLTSSHPISCSLNFSSALPPYTHPRTSPLPLVPASLPRLSQP